MHEPVIIHAKAARPPALPEAADSAQAAPSHHRTYNPRKQGLALPDSGRNGGRLVRVLTPTEQEKADRNDQRNCTEDATVEAPINEPARNVEGIS